MKNKSLILAAAFLAIIIIGCQENQVNAPEMVALTKEKMSDSRTIKLCCSVRDPNYGACNLNGCIIYTHEVINRSINIQGLSEISLRISMNSRLCDRLGMPHLQWRIEDKSDEIVYVSEEGILLLEKTYRITNRNDVVLLVRYLVTTNGMGLANVNLVPLEN